MNIDNSKNINTAPINAGGDVNFIYNEINSHSLYKDKYLTNKPFKPDKVFGRDKDLELISKSLRDDNNILCLLNGEGGIGKTSLAAQYWYNNENRYKHFASIYAGNSIQSAFISLAKKLGIVFDKDTPDHEKVESLLQYLSNLEGPSLLIIDNANDISDLTKNLKNLRGLTNFHIIITSRLNSILGTESIKVTGLDFGNSIKLFEYHYKKIEQSDLEIIRSIFVAINYNTLVIELLSKNLKSLNFFTPNYSLTEMLTDLQKFGLLKLKSKPIQTDYNSESELTFAKPEDIVKAMYNLNSLNNDELRLLCNISVLPPENIKYQHLLSILNPDDLDTFETNLIELNTRGWIEYDSADKYFRCSPIIQTVVIDNNKTELPRLCNELIINLTDTLQRLNLPEIVAYSSFAVNVIKSIKKGTVELADLSLKLSKYFINIGNLGQAISYNQISARIYSSKKQDAKYADTLISLGKIRHAQGNYKEAENLYKANLKLLNSSNSSDAKYRKIITELGIASLSQSKGDLVEFSRIVNKNDSIIRGSLLELQPSRESYIELHGMNCQYIGAAFSDLGDFEMSYKYFSEMQRVFSFLTENGSENDSYQLGLAVAHSRIGMIERDHYDVDRALENFNAYHQISKTLYNKNPASLDYAHNLSRSLDFLGRWYLVKGKEKEAKILLDDSYNLTKEIFTKNPDSEFSIAGYALSCDRLGRYYSKKKDYDKSLYYYNKYNELTKLMVRNNPKSFNAKDGLARSYYYLGETYFKMRSYNEALKNFNDSNSINEEIKEINKFSSLPIEYLSETHSMLGKTLKALSKFDEAFEHLKKAEKFCELLCAEKRISKYCEELGNIRNELLYFNSRP